MDAFVFLRVIQLSFRVNVPQGYDLLSSVHSWIYPDIQPVPEKTGEGYFGRVYNVEGQQVALIFRQRRPGGNLRITYSDYDHPKQTLRKLVERTLNLRFKIDDALKQIRADEKISFIAPLVSGVRPYMSPTPYEALMKTIIQQQVSYKAANVFTKRMVLGLAKPLSFENQDWYSFPDARRIAITGVDGLKQFGFGYKADYIHHSATLIANGHLELDSLLGKSYEEVVKQLKPIRGIGEWTIRVLSLAGLGNFSVFAYDDLVIQKILGNLYNKGQRMTSKQVHQHAESWGASSTIVLYLLMSAEVLGYLSS